jgi:type II secretory pathway pseudopilin PulG
MKKLIYSPLASNMRSPRSGAQGFTLVQLLLVVALLGILAALLFPVLSQAREGANRQKCDVKLKSIVLALDAFRQERGQYPAGLDELQTNGFLSSAEALRCSHDPRVEGSYADFYTIRASGDRGDSPVVCCPFHKAGGNQARLGRFTTQFATKPATLTSGNAVRVLRPGKTEPMVGYAGMELRGGDTIITEASGTALITFADSSSARLNGGADITVLQSFVDGHSAAPLYTVLRQVAGEAMYTVNNGSRFDVSTPAATAGARGTQFRVTVSGNSLEDTQLYVIEGKVVFTSPQKSVLAPVGQPLSALGVGGLVRLLPGL